jgi:AcrR family transcriptional regulator
LTRPTLYHYFGSKRNLFFSLHMFSIERILKPYMATAAAIEDPLERLRFMIRSYATTICNHPELRILIHDTLTINDRYFREVREEWKEHYLLLRSTITQLQSKGVIDKSVNPSLGPLFLLGMTTWMAFWFDRNGKSTAEELAEAVLRFSLQGLGRKDRETTENPAIDSGP